MRTKIKNLVNRYKNVPLPVKASFIYLCVSILQKGLGFITSPIYTRLLDSVEYGRVSVYFSMEQLIGTVAMFSLHAGCFDIGMQEYKEDRDNFVFSTLVLSNVITLICGAILFATYPLLGNYIGISTPLLVAMFCGFFFSPAFTFWTRRERFEYHYKMPGVLTVVGAIVSSVAAVWCIVELPKYRVEARIIGAFIPMLLIYVYFWWYLARKAKFKVNYQYCKFAFLFNLPLIPHYLSAYVLSSSDRLMIAYLTGESEAAYYSLAYTVVAIITIVWSAINSSLVPFVLDKYEKKEYKKVSDTVLPILTIFAGLCLFVILIAPEIIMVLGPEEYYQAIYVIPPVIGGAFFQLLYAIFTNVLYYMKKPSYVMYASISTAVLNIILNAIFIPMFGYIAAGYTTLVCYIFQAVIDYIVSRKLVGQNIYDMKYLSLLSLGVVIFSVSANILYISNVLRYICIGIIVIACMIKRKKLISMLLRK